ncbi:ATP-binding cassette domain-containing protein [Idiomarina xiamenensis]|uniref:Probable ATP-binding protein YheS n=1 Tax=Idiomarina xiamenensis 10-D-4 TaxID=740709 RepID=K2JDR5_9GAMM|nr:ATP-binding cassette domain-containing protein [Idiomarina xiamenensis]EKE81541.1 ABC transporter ATPase [Idiomarina xiamenensis 10-D-4]
MIDVRDLTLMRGGHILLEHSDFNIFPGHRVGLVGRNGCGKSSLFALLRDQIQADSGHCHVPKQWRIASVAQETPALECSALAYVIDGDADYRRIEQAIKQAELANDGEQLGHLHEQLATIQGYDIEARAAILLAGLGFQQAQLQQPVSAFSGGWRMRLNLAQALIARADLLLLDEPTNHLDVDAIFWLEDWLKQTDSTVILISHDRDFLDNTVNQIIHIEHQRCHSYNGNYAQFERQRAEQLAQQQSQFEKEQAMRAHLQQYVDRFRYKASKARQAQSRLKALERLQSEAPLRAANPFSFAFKAADKLPNPLISLRDVQGGYGDNVILEKIQLNLVPGSRFGLLGRNGAGKSTLVKMLAQQLAPQAGEITLNPGLRIGYFAQHQLELLDPQASALLHLQRLDSHASEQQLRDYLGGFGFSGDAATAAVAPMSGGEKARLVLALLVYQRPNLLLLDEPTNHLDLSMREALVMALQSFEGAMVLVSHDRHLLRTSVDEFYLVAEGKVAPFNGDLDAYHDWLQQQAKKSANAVIKADNHSTSDAATTDNASAAKTDRKAEKRAAAELRQKSKPLRDSIARYEADIATYEAQLTTLNEQLTDSSLYSDEAKQQLKALLAEQARLSQQLAATENEWMAAEQALEQLLNEQ